MPDTLTFKEARAIADEAKKAGALVKLPPKPKNLGGRPRLNRVRVRRPRRKQTKFRGPITPEQRAKMLAGTQAKIRARITRLAKIRKAEADRIRAERRQNKLLAQASTSP